MAELALTAVVLVLLLGPPAVLTAVGARRRGNGAALSVVAGLAFPVTWAVWYVRDEHPYARRG